MSDTSKKTSNLQKYKSVKQPKRIFTGLIATSYVLVTLVLTVMWKISFLGLADIYGSLPYIVGLVLLVPVCLTGIGILNLVCAVEGWPTLNILQKQTYGLINMLYPIAIFIGKLLGIDRRSIEGSFVSVSNSIMHNRHIRVPADRLLVVTPHCLQLATCPHKITRDPNNCKRCGGCDIGSLVTMANEMGFHFFVVTGGTLARQTVKKLRPKAVLAIACERDLASGIQDVYPLPAVGVMNIRPNGPCYNTHVDVEDFRRELENIIEK